MQWTGKHGEWQWDSRQRTASVHTGVLGQIWLDASLLAHDFVPAEFWQADHKVMVTELLPGAHGYVHESENGVINGFVVLASGEGPDFMGALFVEPSCQGTGIGTQFFRRETLVTGLLPFEQAALENQWRLDDGGRVHVVEKIEDARTGR